MPASLDRRPLVSIIVPSFNQGPFIRATLESAVAQDYRPLEIVVADGASTDETTAVLREMSAQHPEIRWVSEPDSGPADAVNKGLRMAQGKYAAIQSSDDLYYPGALSAAVEVFEAHPQSSFVFGDCDSFDNDGCRMPRTHLPEFSWDAAFGRAWCYPQGSILFRRDLALDIGGWNSRYYACDLDFWMRLAFRGPPRKVDHLMYGWRRYAGQRTRPDQHARIVADYARMVRESSDVRAASPRIHRLARASCHVIAVRFHPNGRTWSRRRHLLVASLLHPGHWKYSAAADTRELLPGYTLARAGWHRLGRLLGHGPDAREGAPGGR